MKWVDGIQWNSYSWTDEHGSIQACLSCGDDASKWNLIPSGGGHFKIQNKASGNCLYQPGGGNSLLWGFQNCATTTSVYDIQPYVVTTTIVTSSVTSTNLGGSVTFTATVDAQGFTVPDSTVTFRDGSTIIGTANTVNGVATFSTYSLSVGDHPITATYTVTTPTYMQSSTSSALVFTVNDPFIGAFFEFKQVELEYYVMSVALSQGLTEGSLFFTWYQGLTDFSDYTREQFAFTRNADNSYTLTNQQKDGSGNKYCMKWINGVQSNPYSYTTALGSIKSSLVCNDDASKWNLIPASGGKFKIQNKASGTCMYQPGGGNSLLWGFQDCGTTTSVYDILPYVVTTTTVASSVTSTNFGESVTFTATVDAQGFPVPDSTVTFRDGAIALGTATTADGVATYLTYSLGVGDHSITATYSATPAYMQSSTSSAITFTVTDPFIGAFFEFKQVELEYYIMGVALSQGLTEGSLFFTWYQGLTDFSDYTREQFAFTRNADNSYTLTNQQDDGAGNLYCMKWVDGIQWNAYSWTDEHGSIQASLSCGDDAAKWNLIPSGGGHFKIQNKASENCLYQPGGGNSLLWGFQDCGTTTSVYDIQPYVVATSTLTSEVSTASFGESVTFTATITAQGFPVPDAPVTFSDGLTDLGTVNPVNGVATFSIYSLGVGDHSITAVSTVSNPSFVHAATSNAFNLTVTDPFVGAFFEFKHVELEYYVMGVALSQGLAEGSLFFTWYQGLSDFTPATREQFAFTRNADNSYTWTNQHKDGNGNQYCMKWVDGGHSNSYSWTNSLGSIQSSLSCGDDASKWILVPTANAEGVIHFKIKNKASGTCMYPTGGGNSLLWGFQDCVTTTSVYDILPYVVTTTTLTSSSATAKYGEAVTFTATVTAQGFPVPASAVVFSDGTTIDKAVSTDGVATITSFSLGVGTHHVSATWNGAPSYYLSSTSDETEFTVTDAFVEPFYELKNIEWNNYVTSEDSLTLMEGTPFTTSHLGLTDVIDHTTQQFALVQNSDGSYTLTNQEPDIENTRYCVRWITDVVDNAYSSTDALGSIVSSLACSNDDAKWLFTPVAVGEGVHWQIKNKASNTCIGSLGGGDELVFGLSACEHVSPITSWDVVPYDVTFTTGLHELRSASSLSYLTSVSNAHGLTENSIFYAWFQGQGSFLQPQRQQFSFSRTTDGTYTITNQEQDSNGVVYCIRWLEGNVASTADCSLDTAKWLVQPVHVDGRLLYQLKNKASGNCASPVGNENGALVGFQSCSVLSVSNAWDVIFYDP